MISYVITIFILYKGFVMHDVTENIMKGKTKEFPTLFSVQVIRHSHLPAVISFIFERVRSKVGNRMKFDLELNYNSVILLFKIHTRRCHIFMNYHQLLFDLMNSFQNEYSKILTLEARPNKIKYSFTFAVDVLCNNKMLRQWTRISLQYEVHKIVLIC